MELSGFQQKVYGATRRIPRGQVSTYKEIALAIGKPGAARAVGNALNKNPFPIEVPCHRVVRSDLKLGGFSKGPREKKRLLEKEGVLIDKEGLISEEYKYNF